MGTATSQQESDCISPAEVLDRLDDIAPDAPLLALGQTVLWDEPVKGGLALLLRERNSGRRFVAGVHDTDFFAKLPAGERKKGSFRAFPHNDTSTKNLWSAAGEFSALFCGETVVTKQDYLSAGAHLERVLARKPDLLDSATEAFGWRGIVSLDDEPPLAMSVPLTQVFETLQSTLDWAIEQSLDSLAGETRDEGQKAANQLWKRFCQSFETSELGTLTDFYADLLPGIYEFAAGQPVPLEVTRTSELLTFNTGTAELDRFKLLGAFLDPTSMAKARESYNSALAESEIYSLDRFGTGAIPFDLVIPGIGRGTIRVGKRGLVIMTSKPQFASYRQPPTTPLELAAIIERKFGQNCALVGKAITLIGMLATEFVFVFHEGASSYVRFTRRFHQNLEGNGISLGWKPILRVVLPTWDALNGSCAWFKLPPPLQGSFASEEICGPSFASRWRTVAKEQSALLSQLADLRRPIELIRFLDEHLGGAWNTMAREYEGLIESLDELISAMADYRARRVELYRALHEAKLARSAAELKMGAHFREKIFEQEPSDEDLQERERLGKNVERAIDEVLRIRNEIRHLLRRQGELASTPRYLQIHERRRSIEFEAELRRMNLIRSAVISSRGLDRAARRPSAWWFPLVDGSGKWFADTWAGAKCYLEPLSNLA